MNAFNFQAISKLTGEILAEAMSAAALEDRYADHGHWVYLRNANTGVEWDIPETDRDD
jgi:hypothetical protein